MYVVSSRVGPWPNAWRTPPPRSSGGWRRPESEGQRIQAHAAMLNDRTARASPGRAIVLLLLRQFHRRVRLLWLGRDSSGTEQARPASRVPGWREGPPAADPGSGVDLAGGSGSRSMGCRLRSAAAVRDRRELDASPRDTSHGEDRVGWGGEELPPCGFGGGGRRRSRRSSEPPRSVWPHHRVRPGAPTIAALGSWR
jgi:hypothetical protein